MAGAAGQVTVFVGAGISVPAPTGAPDFGGLRNLFLARAAPELKPRLECKEFTVEELSPEQVFDAIDDGNEETRRKLRRELWWLCEPNEPNDNHYAVAALLGAGARVWTPNFDTMIERAAARLGCAVETVLPGDDLRAEPGGPLLCKPHGSFPFSGPRPSEPAVHDYPLLFQASAVWLLQEDWVGRLNADVRDRDVFLFGYRGADPDLTPAMLTAFEQARSVTWWEFGTVRNFPRLARLLAPSSIRLEAGDPSDALQDLAQRLAPHVAPAPTGERLTRPADLEQLRLSNRSRSQLLGQFRGAAAARHYLRRALVLDPEPNRGLLAYRLLRSSGFDLPWVRAPLLAGLSVALRLPRLRRRARLGELYATLQDSRPIRAGDRRAIRRLRRLPIAGRAEIAVRLASMEKLHGDLDEALEDAEASLRDLRTRNAPSLEAMTVYNLAWIHRQRGEFERRRELIDTYAERMPHIGFNWAAWLGLDEALVALHFGEAARADELMQAPTMRYANEIAHPMYELDHDLNTALLRWHLHGPAGVEEGLLAILRRWPARRFARLPFTVVDTLIVLADHARATGDREALAGRLRDARARTCSALQRVEIDLVEATAKGEIAGLERLQLHCSQHSFGLIEQTVAAVVAANAGDPAAGPVVYAPELPLAGTY